VCVFPVCEELLVTITQKSRINYCSEPVSKKIKAHGIELIVVFVHKKRINSDYAAAIIISLFRIYLKTLFVYLFNYSVICVSVPAYHQKPQKCGKTHENKNVAGITSANTKIVDTDPAAVVSCTSSHLTHTLSFSLFAHSCLPAYNIRVLLYINI